MADIRISEKDFIEATEKYPPNGLVTFIYKYFSQGTEGEALKVKNAFGIIIMVLFAAGFLGTVFKLPNAFILYPTIILFCLLAVFGLTSLVAFKMNQARLKKIAKDLGVSMGEYNWIYQAYKK